MPSARLRIIDKRHLTVALATMHTHAGISVFASSRGIDAGEGNKTERANNVVDALFVGPDTDDAVLDLLNYVFTENAYWDPETSEPYRDLKARVLDVRGIEFTDDGFVFAGDSPPEPRRRADATPRVENHLGDPRDMPSSANGGGLSPLMEETSIVEARDPSIVFLVHGRDMRPVRVLEQFLSFVGLRAMDWSAAVSATGKSQPTTYEIVTAGMAAAGAVIVVFSPDDLGRVKDEYANSPTDPDKAPTGQARQNVTLEAGMAYSTGPERTIFVMSENVRPISDIDGFNWVKLNGAWDSRQDLINRLGSARGTAVLPGHSNLEHHTAGPFKVS